MSFLLRHHRKLSEVVTVPEGLRELMADIAREVLRFQPENIEAFIADYLEAMLLTRELCTIADHTIDDVLTSSLHIVELLQKDGMSTEQANSVIKVIKDEFNAHVEEEEPLREQSVVNRLINEYHFTVEQAQKASSVIEDAWCHFYQRNKTQIVNKIQTNDARDKAVRNTLAIYQSANATSSELRQSGSALKSGFKGYLKRKSKASEIKTQRFSNANWQTPNFQKREEAALKIQSWFRGLKDRSVYRKIINAANVIQAAFKRYKARKLKHQIAEESIGRDSSIEVKSFTKVEDDAAKKIQIYYRAYKLRQHLKIQQRAAILIQAHFKGYLVRKQVKH